ncbi:hypothetical protein [Chryseobacterium sp. SIMBA_029]|uniref:hypothetical protein n=1 Tax=Chryseobacterium sp. SIMBA_029 TaxID=3085772 RepID=UPI00397C72A0
MKSLYITTLLLLSVSIYAQESNTTELKDQTLVVKGLKDQDAQMIKNNQENTQKKQAPAALVSEQGLAVKKQEQQSKAKNDNSEKLLPNTASIEEIKKTIPNRQATTHTANSRNTNNTIPGIPNTATLEEIKRTIPKN